MSRRAQTSAAKRAGTPASAVIASGVRGWRDEVLPIGKCTIGDVVELVQRANYRGMQNPLYLEAGTRVRVGAHVANPTESTLVTVEASPSWIAYIDPATSVRVVRSYQPSGTGGGAELDPLLRGVAR